MSRNASHDASSEVGATRFTVAAGGTRGSTAPAVLAIDAGNSKTDVLLAAPDGSVLASGKGPGFRPHEDGAASALGGIAAVVERLAAELGLGADAAGSANRAPVIAAHTSAFLANADLPVEERAYEADLRARGWSRDVTVGNDTLALLRAGASRPWGVAVVCGAGINCAAVAPDGRAARFPAVGKPSGDWGGGLGLGEEALWYAARSDDGRGEPTELAHAVPEHFGLPSVSDVTLAVHFGEVPEHRLAELAPTVLRVAAAGDAVAVALVERLAEEVMLLAEVAMRRLGMLGDETEVVLGGGIMTARTPVLESAIERRFAARAPRARLIVTTAPPVLGAALLGFDALRGANRLRDVELIGAAPRHQPSPHAAAPEPDVPVDAGQPRAELRAVERRLRAYFDHAASVAATGRGT